MEIPRDFAVAQSGLSREKAELWADSPHFTRLSHPSRPIDQAVGRSENSSLHGNMTNSLHASDGVPLITGIADLLYAGLHNFLSGNGSCIDEVTSLMNPVVLTSELLLNMTPIPCLGDLRGSSICSCMVLSLPWPILG
jgi:hypothetical protein